MEQPNITKEELEQAAQRQRRQITDLGEKMDLMRKITDIASEYGLGNTIRGICLMLRAGIAAMEDPAMLFGDSPDCESVQAARLKLVTAKEIMSLTPDLAEAMVVMANLTEWDQQESARRMIARSGVEDREL